ncbi:MAG: imidazole glycerol phosphate synthase subunit HisH, partial [Candidatus Hydrogenedentota bacterium]
LILPGQGHFGTAMERLHSRGFVSYLRHRLGRENPNRPPFLGICLGLQILFEGSEESPGIEGLGLYPGTVRRFPTRIENRRLIVPLMGWKKTETVRGSRPGIFAPTTPLREDPWWYFVHSYFVPARLFFPNSDILLTALETWYGVPFTAAIADPPLYATQFHPEKSGREGLELLRRFVETTKRFLQT